MMQVPGAFRNTEADAAIQARRQVKPSIVLEVGGQKIGIIGAVTNDTPETRLARPQHHHRGRRQVDDTAEVEKLKARRRQQDHRRDPYRLSSDERDVIAKIPGIDVVVGGHSHSLLSNTDPKAEGPYPTMVDNPDGYKVPVVQAASYSKYLGEFKVVFDDNGVVKAANGDPIYLDKSITPDPAVLARIKELGAPIEALKNKEVAETTDVIDGSRENLPHPECAMGNLVSDAILDRVKGQGVEIAISNGGGLRASIDQGDVTMGEVLTVLPFQNTLATFQISGKDMVAGAENGLSQIEEGAGRFPQVAGLKYSFDISRPVGSRMSAVEVMQKAAPGRRSIRQGLCVVLPTIMSARAATATRSSPTSAKNAYDYGPGLEQVVADYLGKNTPYKPYTDGRITVLAPGASAEAKSSEPATTPKPPEAAKPAETAAAASAANHHPDSYTIKRGDNFWDIAEEVYGKGSEWKKLAGANPDMKVMKLPIGAQIKYRRSRANSSRQGGETSGSPPRTLRSGVGRDRNSSRHLAHQRVMHGSSCQGTE